MGVPWMLFHSPKSGQVLWKCYENEIMWDSYSLTVLTGNVLAVFWLHSLCPDDNQQCVKMKNNGVEVRINTLMNDSILYLTRVLYLKWNPPQVQGEEHEKNILNCSHIVGLCSPAPARLELWEKSSEKRDHFKNGEALWKHTNVPKKEICWKTCNVLTSYSCGQSALWNTFLHKFVVGNFISLNK